MFYKKKGKPTTGELVLCTVKKISLHSVFVSLDEYLNVEGMIHISEIAPGRIRNLRDYVKEGKRIVCKVLYINPATGNIDLSLRRVGTSFMVQKINEEKQEEKSEKLLESVGTELKLSLAEMYKQVGEMAIMNYGSLHNFFQEIVASGKEIIDELKIPGNLSKRLYEVVKEKIKPVEFTAEGTLKLVSYDSNGVDIVKEALKTIDNAGGKVTYLGAPKYKVEFTSFDKKEASKKLSSSTEKAIAIVSKTGEGEFNKIG